MNNPEIGNAYPYQPDIKHFYTSVCTTDEYDALYAAAHEFMTETGFIDEPFDIQIFIKHETFDATQSPDDIDCMRDFFLVLPMKALEMFGQYNSLLADPDQLERWYSEMTDFIIDYCDDHTLNCLMTSEQGEDECDHSIFCPVRYVARVLTSDVIAGPVDDTSYEIYENPLQRREAIIRKFDVAIEYGLYNPTFYDEAVADYDVAFDEIYPVSSSQA